MKKWNRIICYSPNFYIILLKKCNQWVSSSTTTKKALRLGPSIWFSISLTWTEQGDNPAWAMLSPLFSQKNEDLKKLLFCVWRGHSLIPISQCVFGREDGWTLNLISYEHTAIVWGEGRLLHKHTQQAEYKIFVSFPFFMWRVVVGASNCDTVYCRNSNCDQTPIK